MNIRMGSQIFSDVEIPLLWGVRAILQDKKGRVSVINLQGERAELEILGDKPAPNISYEPTLDGFKILKDGEALYNYNPSEKILRSISLGLPECEIREFEIRIGGGTFSGNIVSGYGVGIVVTKEGIGMGAPLPKGLAKLVI